MSEAAEQGSNTPEPTHSPSDWATKLHESSKAAPEGDEQTKAPQEEEAELEVDETEGEAPASDEGQDTADEEDTETEALEDEEDAEPSDTEPEHVSIAADNVYMVDGEEIDGQTLLNGIAATKNFAQEKHRLREEASAELNERSAELQSKQDEYAQATSFMIGMNQQAYQQVENQLAQTTDPQEFQRLRQQQGHMQQAQQQLKGQFDQFLTNVGKEKEESSRKQAEQSLAILKDKFTDDGWNTKYPKLRESAKDYGFEAKEFLGITDHRMMMMLSDLNEAKEKIATMESVTKRKTSKTVKEKNKRNSMRVNTTIEKRTGDAMDSAKKSHKPKDWANAWQAANTKQRSR